MKRRNRIQNEEKVVFNLSSRCKDKERTRRYVEVENNSKSIKRGKLMNRTSKNGYKIPGKGQ